MSLHFIFIYSITIFVASIIPGPSMLLALTHGMQYGARRTIASAMGNLTVTLLQASISIAGLGAVLLASEVIFQGIKWAGAAFLIYMGIGIFRAKKLSIAPVNGTQSVEKTPLRKMYVQAALVTAGNPKAIVFFTAIYPQFITPGSNYLSQISILLTTGSLIAFSCFMAYAIGGQKIVSLFSEAVLGKYLTKLIGGTFIGTGIGLAASSR